LTGVRHNKFLPKLSGPNVQCVGWRKVCKRGGRDNCFFGDFVVLIAAKNLRSPGEILHCAQNDSFARIFCHTNRRLAIFHNLGYTKNRPILRNAKGLHEPNFSRYCPVDYRRIADFIGLLALAACRRARDQPARVTAGCPQTGTGMLE
jgi:hypothetical protein